MQPYCNEDWKKIWVCIPECCMILKVYVVKQQLKGFYTPMLGLTSIMSIQQKVTTNQGSWQSCPPPLLEILNELEFKCEFGQRVLRYPVRLHFIFVGPWALFMGPATWEKRKFNFKTRPHSTIHTFKNYFITVFLVFSFQFLTISGIQTEFKYEMSVRLSLGVEFHSQFKFL